MFFVLFFFLELASCSIPTFLAVTANLSVTFASSVIDTKALAVHITVLVTKGRCFVLTVSSSVAILVVVSLGTVTMLSSVLESCAFGAVETIVCATLAGFDFTSVRARVSEFENGDTQSDGTLSNLLDTKESVLTIAIHGIHRRLPLVLHAEQSKGVILDSEPTMTTVFTLHVTGWNGSLLKFTVRPFKAIGALARQVCVLIVVGLARSTVNTKVFGGRVTSLNRFILTVLSGVTITFLILGVITITVVLKRIIWIRYQSQFVYQQEFGSRAKK